MVDSDDAMMMMKMMMVLIILGYAILMKWVVEGLLPHTHTYIQAINC